jgi:formylglycine-generating enzyme required for sulfatase activity
MTRSTIRLRLALALVTAPTAALAHAPIAVLSRCATDAVVAGTVCLDRYEASVWRVPNPTTTNALLVRKIQLGRASQADLATGGATQLGTVDDDYAPCRDDGQNCANDIYALSLPAQIPSAHITWFQAQEACANAGKRLPSNAEWQVGANGTPDPGPDDGTTDCNTGGDGSLTPTGARSGCVSARRALDMVGNLSEWVADWVPLSTACPGWAGFSDDFMCLAGAATSAGGPGALVRGGAFLGGAINGPLMVAATFSPSRSQDSVGFRCAR